MRICLLPCRASLSTGASPTLQAAGATLAATFLEKGLAGGDAAVLDRLMSLLSAPLATQAFHPPLPQRATAAAAAQRGWTSPRARARPQQQSQPLQMVLDPVSVLGDVSKCVGVELWDLWMRVCVCALVAGRLRF